MQTDIWLPFRHSIGFLTTPAAPNIRRIIALSLKEAPLVQHDVWIVRVPDHPRENQLDFKFGQVTATCSVWMLTRKVTESTDGTKCDNRS